MWSKLAGFLVVGGLMAVVLAAVPEGETWSSSGLSDCRGFTPTPTVSPSPTPTPPFTPWDSRVICNNTSQTASDLHIQLNRPAANAQPISSNAAGCPAPSLTFTPAPSSYTRVDVVWETPCIEPGEYVHVYFEANCTTTTEPGCMPPRVTCSNWTNDDVAIPSSTQVFYASPYCDPPPPTVTPPSTITPSPTPTPQPGECPPRPTPPFSDPPTPRPQPDPTPPGPWATGTSYYPTIEFCNDTGQPANGLYIYMAHPFSSAQLQANAPGCAGYPQMNQTSSLDYELDVYWSDACVDAGERVSILFSYFCYGIPCYSPQPFCHAWLQENTPITGQAECPGPFETSTGPTPSGQTPTPTPTANPCGPRPAPTLPYPTHPPTPVTVGPTSRDVILQNQLSFCNNAAVSVSDLHIYMGHPYSFAEVTTNAPGCPAPVLTFDPQPWDKLTLDVDWGTACVQPGESVHIQFTYGCGDSPCIYPSVFCFTWTLNDEFVDSEGACPTVTPTATPPTVTPTVTPTPTPGPACPAATAPPGGTCPPCPGFGGQGGVIIQSTCPPPPTSPGPTPIPEIGQGDLNCTHTNGSGGGIGVDDATLLLAHLGGLPADTGACPEIGSTASNGAFGDLDCDDDVDTSDLLLILYYLVGLPTGQLQQQLCPPMGAWPASGT